jgi:hypothetical protein
MYYAIPLADQGFRPVDQYRNRVRWYVERDDRAWPVLGPYASKDAAEFAAAQLNERGE